MAAARNAPPVQVTDQIVQEIKSLYPIDPRTSQLLRRPSCQAYSCQKWPSSSPTTLRKMPRLSEPGPLGMRAEHWYDFGALAGRQQPVCASSCTHCSSRCPALSSAVPQIWSGDTPRQTHRGTSTTPHDVLPPQTCSQVSHGSQEGISCQMCWTPTVWSGTTRWCKHDDQDHSISCGGGSHSSPCCA